LLFLFAVILTVCGEKVKYNGYSVLRMQINNTNLHDILNIAERFNLDIWAQNAQEKWMDIMVPPNQDILKFLKQHDHVVSIGDVEEHIQYSETRNVTRKRQAFFDVFPTFDEVNLWLNEIKDLYPANTLFFEVGETYDGTKIRGIKLFTAGQGKNSIYIQGGIHAREWISVTSALYIIQQFLVDQTVIADTDVYIVPIFNIDGYQYTHDVDRLWRKNRQPNSGTSCVGTDLNRNYRFQWGREGSGTGPCEQTFRGASAESSPEVWDISNYISSLPNLVFYLDIHSYGGMFMSAWGFTTGLPDDYGQMYQVMEVAQNAIQSVNGNTYLIGSSARVIYIVSGGSRDFAYGALGVVPSFTVEMVGTSFTPPTSQILPLAREIYSGVEAVAKFVSK